jgi:hypothetical protein
MKVMLRHAVLRIRWHPLSVQTGSESSPTLRAKAASSNGFCICPRSKYPRSPPRLALEQSERLVANAERVSSPDWILVWYSWIVAKASSLVRVIFSCQSKKENKKLIKKNGASSVSIATTTGKVISPSFSLLLPLSRNWDGESPCA